MSDPCRSIGREIELKLDMPASSTLPCQTSIDNIGYSQLFTEWAFDTDSNVCNATIDPAGSLLALDSLSPLRTSFFGHPISAMIEGQQLRWESLTRVGVQQVQILRK